MTMKDIIRHIQIVNQTQMHTFAGGELSLLADLVLRQALPKAQWRICIELLNDQQIRKYNQLFFKKNRPTDVISLPMGDASSGFLEGEIYISLETALRQADEYNVTLLEEVLRLTAHGLYHLLGHDDASEKERLHMTALEDGALEAYRKFGAQ